MRVRGCAHKSYKSRDSRYHGTAPRSPAQQLPLPVVTNRPPAPTLQPAQNDQYSGRCTRVQAARAQCRAGLPAAHRAPPSWNRSAHGASAHGTCCQPQRCQRDTDRPSDCPGKRWQARAARHEQRRWRCTAQPAPPCNGRQPTPGAGPTKSFDHADHAVGNPSPDSPRRRPRHPSHCLMKPTCTCPAPAPIPRAQQSARTALPPCRVQPATAGAGRLAGASLPPNSITVLLTSPPPRRRGHAARRARPGPGPARGAAAAGARPAAGGGLGLGAGPSQGAAARARAPLPG
jgi:hypothetical protein